MEVLLWRDLVERRKTFFRYFVRYETKYRYYPTLLIIGSNYSKNKLQSSSTEKGSLPCLIVLTAMEPGSAKMDSTKELCPEMKIVQVYGITSPEDVTLVVVQTLKCALLALTATAQVKMVCCNSAISSSKKSPLVGGFFYYFNQSDGF